jgi:hypothetical protein
MKMKKNFVKMISGTIPAVIVVSVLTFGLAFGQDASRAGSPGGGGGRLEGTWDAQVAIKNCGTGAVLNTFASIGTFMQGGTSIGSTAGIPQSLRTPEHGVWSHLSGNTYFFKFKTFSFDAAGNSTGWSIVQHYVYLDQGGDTYTSAGTAEFYAPNGNLLFTGCSSAIAVRFQ